MAMMWDAATYDQLRAEGKFTEAENYLTQTWETHPSSCTCFHCCCGREDYRHEDFDWDM